MPPEPTPPLAARRHARRGAGLLAALLVLTGLAALLSRRPAPVGPLADLTVLRIVRGPEGFRVASVQVSNRLDRPLAWLPVGRLDTDPGTNRAALHLPGVVDAWVLPPHARREFAFAIDQLGTNAPWRTVLYARLWRGTLGDALDRVRESARIRGVPLPPPRPYEPVASDWTDPAPASTTDGVPPER